jgi:hypothetical protein
MSLKRPQNPSNASKNPVGQPRWNSPDAEVRTTAYYIWEREGRPAGRALDHWLRAENEVRRLRDAGPIRDQSS